MRETNAVPLYCRDAVGVTHRLSRGSTYPGQVHKNGYLVCDNNGTVRYFRGTRFIDSTGHLCRDCGYNTLESDKDYYLVHDAIWQRYGLGQQPGMLCVNCLEKRMGHPLLADQLTGAPINTLLNPFTRSLLLAAGYDLPTLD